MHLRVQIEILYTTFISLHYLTFSTDVVVYTAQIVKDFSYFFGQDLFEVEHVPFLIIDDSDDPVFSIIPRETSPTPSHRESIEVNAKCGLRNSLSITMQSWIQSDNAKVRANV